MSAARIWWKRGADAFLMPSRVRAVRPQSDVQHALRHGPDRARAVGGLVDTVHPYDPATGQGTGFLFGDYDPWALFGRVAPRASRRIARALRGINSR